MTPHSLRLVVDYAQVHRMYSKMYVEMDALRNECQRSMDAGMIVDTVYVLKKISQFADAIRKEANKALDITQKLGCIKAMQTPDNKLVGELATGYGDSSTKMLLPDRTEQPAEYAALMKAIGVPDDVATNAAIRPSFSGVAEYTTQLAADGKQLPPGLEHARTIPTFNIIARPRKDLDELAQMYGE